MVTVLAGSASDVGCYREVNEDSVLAGAGVFAVADGMGGHAAGDVASALAVARLLRLDATAEVRPEDVRSTLAAANQDILDAGDAQPERAGMGTTVSGLSLVRFAGSQHWAVFNVGDSRVYRFADDVLTQMTVDHSEVAELVARGEITPEQARTDPRGNIVTRVLGTDPAPDVDVWVFPPTAGERFVVCSDGLTRELLDGEIAAVLRGAPDAQKAATELVRLAVSAGGHDNVTVVVVDNVAAPAGPIRDRGDADEDTIPRPARS